jgi:hypothetical protein
MRLLRGRCVFVRDPISLLDLQLSDCELHHNVEVRQQVTA